MTKLLLSILACFAVGVPTVQSTFIDFQPLELRSSNGMLDVTLTVDMVQSLHGIEWSNLGYRNAPGYNGAAVGPTLRVRPGDTLKVTLRNELPPSTERERQLLEYVMDPTSDDANVTIIYNRLAATGSIGPPAFGFWGFNLMNLHFHGMDFSPKEENLLQHVDGGESRTLTLKVPDNKEPGLFWYHDHAHGTATYAYLASLFGMIIVEGDTDSDLTKAIGLQDAREILMIFSDGLVNPDGSVPPSFPVFATFNWTGVTNGNMGGQTTYHVTQGDTVLFRTASATSEAILSLSITNTTLVLLANDGLVLSKPQVTDSVIVAGGARAEFAARFDTPGTYVMKRAPWSPLLPNLAACTAGGFPFYPCWSFDKEQIAATIVVSEKPYYEAPTNGLEKMIQLPAVSDRLQTLAKTKPVDTKDYVLKLETKYPLFQINYTGPFVPPGIGFGINKRLLTPHHFEGSVRAGTCETWNIISDPPGLEHTFHIHQANFLVKVIDGIVQDDPVWHDAVVIRQNATVHMCFDRAEADDVIIAHCHAPNHFDNGMGALYRVTAPLPSKPTVTGLSLINSKTNAKIVDLADGMVINVKDIPGMSTPSFNINASYTGDVDSVEYWYGYDKYRIEEMAPYSFCGNWRSDFFRCRKLGCGNHTVSAVPYAQPSAQGEIGVGLMVSFAIVCA